MNDTTSPTLPSSFGDRLKLVRERIASAAAKASRSPDSISLLAVSKGFSPENIEEAYATGIRDFAESYVQEWSTKYQALKHLPDIKWHFIGNLQSNKAKFLYNSLASIHSINRLSIAEVLERLRLRDKSVTEKLPFFIEVEVSAADTKKIGLSPAELEEMAKTVRNYQTMEWIGFMGMGPAEMDADALRPLYAEFMRNANEIWKKFKPDNAAASPVISLGMSDDLEVAIEAGSTIVRIGTALFGKR